MTTKEGYARENGRLIKIDEEEMAALLKITTSVPVQKASQG